MRAALGGEGNGRDFTGDDYETLSQLDQTNHRQVNEKMQVAISSLPTYSFKCNPKSSGKPVEGAISSTSCSICIETFVEEETVKILPCFH